jgi:predicted RNA-binding Zn-ribbon protein involved in translation (DUF1610 family)
MLKFVPGSNSLTCEFCGQINHIETHFEAIKEYNLTQALREIEKAHSVQRKLQIQCENCGASFSFGENIHAGECPFCGTSIVTHTATSNPIKPKSLLPFNINETESKNLFHSWLMSLWFAPRKVTKYARQDAKITGVYLPYWTFDSDTTTSYTGSRGDTYYVNQRVSYIENGRRVSRIRQVPKIRWSPVRGSVSRFFDDVLVEASHSLPRQLLDHLQPWDLENLVPYDERYLSGMSSEYYQVNLDQGFDHAKQKMENVIYQDIAFDIGGDQQRIHRQHTVHNDNTYKHCLLPVWSAAFNYRNKTYRFVINGRTGEVQGERPYSVWKITFAVMLALLLASGIVFILNQSGVLQQTQYEYPY